MKKFIVSPSPHVHSGDSIKNLMYGVIIAMIPALAASFWFFGLGAIIVTLTSVAACMLFEFLIQKYILKKPTSITDGSAIITGILLAFNVPSNLPIALIIIGAAVAIGIGKMTFGGLGNNPFNPALVGRVFLLIAFPVQMTSWPTPFESPFAYLDATTGATPLALLKEGVDAGATVPEMLRSLPSYIELLLGKIGGSAGEVSAIALLIGLGYMLIKKIITWHIPVAVLGSMALFAGMMHGINPETYADPLFHLLTGGALLGAIFMATDYATSPMTVKGMWIYGVGIGVLTMLIRTFGAYPEGMSFAILIMNAFTPLIDTYVKPRRFGEVIKEK